MQHPNNDLFDWPPVLATRSSTADVFISPRLQLEQTAAAATAAHGLTTPAVAISSPALITVPTPTSVCFTAPMLQPFDGMNQQQDLGEGTSAMRAQVTAPVATAPTTQVTTVALAASMAATPAMVGSGADSTFAPSPCRGMDAEDADGWITRFAAYRGCLEHERLNLLAMLLRDEASVWYDSLNDTTRAGWSTLKEAFEQRFQSSELTRWRKANDLWQRVQGVGESVDSYITGVKKLAEVVGVQGAQLCYALQRGLRLQILAHVIQAQSTTVDDLVRAARVAEAAFLGTTTMPTDASMECVAAELAANKIAAKCNTLELRRFTKQLAAKPISNVDRSRTPSPSACPTTPHHVTFAQRWEQPVNPSRQPYWRGQSGSGPHWTAAMAPQTSTTNNCQYCNSLHLPGKQYCRAANVECFLCKKVGHLARVCRRARRQNEANPGYNLNRGLVGTGMAVHDRAK